MTVFGSLYLYKPLQIFRFLFYDFRLKKLKTINKAVIGSIYLVDDDEDDRMIFAEVLSEIDSLINLKLIQSGHELSHLLCVDLDPVPDIIFLNVNMPIKNGFDCLKEIRVRQDNLKSLKIIMYSTSNNADTIKTCLELGADFYAVKPVSMFDLRSLLIKVMEIDWTVSTENKVL